MTEQKWSQPITKIEPNKVAVRGYRIDELMGRVPFAHVVYLALKGELPTEAQGRVMDAYPGRQRGPRRDAALGAGGADGGFRRRAADDRHRGRHHDHQPASRRGHRGLHAGAAGSRRPQARDRAGRSRPPPASWWRSTGRRRSASPATATASTARTRAPSNCSPCARRRAWRASTWRWAGASARR